MSRIYWTSPSEKVEVLGSVKDLIAAIRTFIDANNERCQPFGWTKTPDQILARATHKPTSDARH